MNIPVVNLGFHGGMGENFHYKMAEMNIKENDIVIHAPFVNDKYCLEVKDEDTNLTEVEKGIFIMIEDPFYILIKMR